MSSRLQGAGDTFRNASAHLCVWCSEDFRKPIGNPRFLETVFCDSVHPNWFAKSSVHQQFKRQSNEEDQTVWKQP